MDQLPKPLMSIMFLLTFFQCSLAGQENALPKFQQDFIYEILPVIRTVNAEITDQRNFVSNIIIKLEQQTSLTDQEKADLHQLLEYYRIKTTLPIDSLLNSPESMDSLLLKIDIIPEKIALAQAAIESDWGRSRFAREGNSYFGIRCKQPGCGIVPNGAANEGFYVKSYPSIDESVRNYARFLNAGTYYDDFRKRRNLYRSNGQKPDSLYIVEGLTMYSIKRDRYIKSLKSLIKYNFAGF